MGDLTLKRFFVFHCILPFVVLALASLHIALVHTRGQVGSEVVRQPLLSSTIGVYPSFVLKDVTALAFYLLALCILCLLVPSLFVNSANYAPADYLNTPSDISPEWYFLFYFSILKAFESKAFATFVAVATTLFVIALPVTHGELTSKLLIAFYRLASVSVFVCFAVMSFLGRRKPTALTSFVSKVCVL